MAIRNEDIVLVDFGKNYDGSSGAFWCPRCDFKEKTCVYVYSKSPAWVEYLEWTCQRCDFPWKSEVYGDPAP